MSGFVTPNTPNVADYTTFLQTGVGIPTSALPSDSPWITYAFNQAMALTAYIPTITPIEYVLAVYNCATHIQLKITPDLTAVFTASITNGVLDVTIVTNGTLTVGMAIQGVASPNPTIIQLGTGTGGTGTYTLNNADLNVSSTSMTGQGTYFSNLRGGGEGGFNLVGVPTGFLSASSDQGTAQSMVVPESLQQLSLTDLDFVRTPWGRNWIEYNQDIGPLWGLS